MNHPIPSRRNHAIADLTLAETAVVMIGSTLLFLVSTVVALAVATGGDEPDAGAVFVLVAGLLTFAVVLGVARRLGNWLAGRLEYRREAVAC
ncbi:hypothetical protein [Halopiger goleimassiliensis]|uniref:hypothetical protein n=1 Tax=Halopiger goleimassiliensis TaxID=1293048 RepID=UPI000677D720|nr:hypothetical protein [Halopiger goleimassiliensis]